VAIPHPDSSMPSTDIFYHFCTCTLPIVFWDKTTMELSGEEGGYRSGHRHMAGKGAWLIIFWTPNHLQFFLPT